mmetsp:Transcript_57118/g.124118  ORF Transcript_57118/g.124118 Transcript_57118/m.124118 type:complete len:210 (-) Transcript_57118:1844-2473(-)
MHHTTPRSFSILTRTGVRCLRQRGSATVVWPSKARSGRTSRSPPGCSRSLRNATRPTSGWPTSMRACAQAAGKQRSSEGLSTLVSRRRSSAWHSHAAAVCACRLSRAVPPASRAACTVVIKCRCRSSILAPWGASSWEATWRCLQSAAPRQSRDSVCTPRGAVHARTSPSPRTWPTAISCRRPARSPYARPRAHASSHRTGWIRWRRIT